MRRGMLAVLAVVLLAGCAAPTQQYVAADGMFFALPRDWKSVPAQQLTTAEKGWSDDAGNVFRQTVRWQGAWTASGLNADQVLAARPSDAPVVFAFVRDLIDVEQQAIGGNVAASLRDVVIPASTLTEGQVVQESLRAQGFRGIRQTATYDIDGTPQTTIAVSMLAPGKDRVYVLLARCTKRCFDQNRSAIGAIIDSLTFKEPRA